MGSPKGDTLLYICGGASLATPHFQDKPSPTVGGADKFHPLVDNTGIRLYSFLVKTTIDLPEELVLQAKTAALLRKTTLRNLVLRGLEREIQHPSPAKETPLRALLSLEADLWTGTSADAYVETLRRDWT
jgi:hypothetical protein